MSFFISCWLMIILQSCVLVFTVLIYKKSSFFFTELQEIRILHVHVVCCAACGCCYCSLHCTDTILLFFLETALHSHEWKYFAGSLYYISSTEKSWQESRNDCLQKGADLVIINNHEEQVCVLNTIPKLLICLHTDHYLCFSANKEFTRRWKKLAWIGLTDAETEGKWTWVDGTLLGTPRLTCYLSFLLTCILCVVTHSCTVGCTVSAITFIKLLPYIQTTTSTNSETRKMSITLCLLPSELNYCSVASQYKTLSTKSS